jgi:hypothetical protein
MGLGLQRLLLVLSSHPSPARWQSDEHTTHRSQHQEWQLGNFKRTLLLNFSHIVLTWNNLR